MNKKTAKTRKRTRSPQKPKAKVVKKDRHGQPLVNAPVKDTQEIWSATSLRP